ncbi:hypothetical protein [Pseudomonas sp. F01002]|uniref:hypothetical protein n=1 Tax=Pseudomonas sp. F01002 TaxID=2555724 RepID=UPI001068F97D|nr:hypothetical protein [Pseudomonas sp. F01002]TFB40939.1 hypothetical protein E3W21_12995 [Pseudomonas sp. F01002]
MNTEQKKATGELLAIVGAVLLFLCAVPVAYMLVVSLVSRAYSLGTFFSVFLQMPQMLLWWIGLIAGVMCFHVRRVVLGSSKS